jgi:hypothetical protein
MKEMFERMVEEIAEAQNYIDSSWDAVGHSSVYWTNDNSSDETFDYYEA